MNRLKYIFATLALFVFASSCNITDVNIDPTRVDDVDLNLMLPEAQTQFAYNQSAAVARMAGIVMQYYQGSDAQQVQYSDYIIAEDAFNNYWNIGLYSGVLRSSQVIIEKAQEAGNTYYEGIAKVIMAESYAQATLMFGDIPFSQALLGQDNLKPTYDSQEQVMQGVLSLLDEAIALLGNPQGVQPTTADIIANGSADTWMKVARGLKARYLVQLSKRNPAGLSEALTQIDGSFAGVDEQAEFAYEDTQIGNNPLAKFGIERPNTLVIGDSFSGSMTARNDPRQPYYMDTTADGTFIYFNSNNPDLVWAANASSIPIISFVELKFLEAEALQRTGGSAADVQAALREGIAASFTQLGLDAMSAENAAFIDRQSDLSGLSGDDVIDRIITEAYYAYYGYAMFQSWNNYRRTGYPDELVPAPNGANGLNPSGIIPRRFLYPVSEVQTNSANLQAAKDRQSGALLDSGMWIFQ